MYGTFISIKKLANVYIIGNIMGGATFYNVLYGINYRLPNVTQIVAVCIYSVEGLITWALTKILPNSLRSN